MFGRVATLALSLAAIIALSAWEFVTRASASPSESDIAMALSHSFGPERVQIGAPLTCVPQASRLYGPLFQCSTRLETALPGGEQRSTPTTLVLAPFDQRWTVIERTDSM